MLNADTMADLMEKALKQQKTAEKLTKPVTATGTVAKKVVQSPAGTAGARLQTEENRNAFLTDALGRSYDVQGNRMAR